MTPADVVRPMVPCSHCGAPIDPQTAVYSKFGTLICRMCEGAAMVHSTQQRALGSVAYGALAAGLGAWVIQFVPAFGAWLALGSAVGGIAGGIRGVQLLGRPEYRTTARRGGQMACAILGIVFGALYCLAFVLVIAGILTILASR